MRSHRPRVLSPGLVHYETDDNVKRIMATEGINPDKHKIKDAYVVPKDSTGIRMALSGGGVYKVRTFVENDEYGFSLAFQNGKTFSEVGYDVSGANDAEKQVQSPLKGLPCAVRKADTGLTMREMSEDDVADGVTQMFVFGSCERRCNASDIDAAMRNEEAQEGK